MSRARCRSAPNAEPPIRRVSSQTLTVPTIWANVSAEAGTSWRWAIFTAAVPSTWSRSPRSGPVEVGQLLGGEHDHARPARGRGRSAASRGRRPAPRTRRSRRSPAAAPAIRRWRAGRRRRTRGPGRRACPNWAASLPYVLEFRLNSTTSPPDSARRRSIRCPVGATADRAVAGTGPECDSVRIARRVPSPRIALRLVARQRQRGSRDALGQRLAGARAAMPGEPSGDPSADDLLERRRPLRVQLLEHLEGGLDVALGGALVVRLGEPLGGDQLVLELGRVAVRERVPVARAVRASRAGTGGARPRPRRRARRRTRASPSCRSRRPGRPRRMWSVRIVSSVVDLPAPLAPTISAWADSCRSLSTTGAAVARRRRARPRPWAAARAAER